jgi:hypothetical protein
MEGLQLHAGPRIYNYNYDEVEFLDLNLETLHGEYLQNTTMLRSYLSKASVGKIIAHDTGIRYAYEICVRDLIHEMYVGMCVYDELQHYVSFLNVELRMKGSPLYPDGHKLSKTLKLLSDRRFYYNVLSYEFINAYAPMIDMSYVISYMRLTNALVAEHPQLLNIELDLSLNPKLFNVLRTYQKLYPETQHPCFAHGVSTQCEELGCVYYVYRFNAAFVKQYRRLIDFKTMLREYDDMPREVLETYNLHLCDHSVLLRQKHCDERMIRALDRENALNEYALLSYVYHELPTVSSGALDVLQLQKQADKLALQWYGKPRLLYWHCELLATSQHGIVSHEQELKKAGIWELYVRMLCLMKKYDWRHSR